MESIQYGINDLSGLTLVFQLINMVLLAGLVYCIVLFIKLARRAIRALDIWLEKNGTDKK